jgi:hypothetical protein
VFHLVDHRGEVSVVASSTLTGIEYGESALPAQSNPDSRLQIDE